MDIYYENKLYELVENEIKYIYSLINKKNLNELLQIIYNNLKKIYKILNAEMKIFFDEYKSKKNKSLIFISNLTDNINDLYTEIIKNKDNREIKQLFNILVDSNIYINDNKYILYIILINSILLYNTELDKFYIYKDKKLNIKQEIKDINISYELNIIDTSNEDIIMNNFKKTIKTYKLDVLCNEFKN